MGGTGLRKTGGWRTHAKLAAVAAGVVCATAGVATAATSAYKIGVSAPKRVQHKHPFTVKASGFAKARSEVSLVLTDKKCANTSEAESKRVSVNHKRGDSYFVAGPTGKSPWSNPYFVKRSFKRSTTAHAGTKTGTQYLCAYLQHFPSGTTLAHDATTFRVMR